MIEEWKDIILSDYKGLYKISNTGKILHLEREKTNKMDVFANKEFILNSKISRGYEQVQLTNKERKNKLFYVHYLVALHFVYNPKPNEYLYINHKDENKMVYYVL